jgi:hypothetical protein
MTARRLLLFLTVLFLQSLPGLPLHAQSGQYIIEQRFIVRLAWVEDRYVLKYEVVIEQEKGEGYRAFLREFTELSIFQVSLIPGNYRYRVIPYDFLEQPGQASDWVILNIPAAPIIPVEVQRKGDDDYLLIPYNGSELVPGVYEIIIKNPDELEINDGVITVEKQDLSAEKRITIYLNAAWAPVFPLYGGIQQIFGNKLYFPGATFRFGLTYNKPKLFTPGLELATSWYALKKVQGSNKIVIHSGIMGFNFLARKRLPNNQDMAITLRAGGGLTFQIGDLNSAQDTFTIAGIAPHINLEPSFLWQLTQQLYLETGLGYTLFLNRDNHSGYLWPWIGVGWNF